jgi:hypothetical protein
VERLTKGLKGKHSTRYDDIAECLIKLFIQMMKKSLACINNESLYSGVFPNEWKIAKVKPLYIKRDRYNIQNYRPISVLSILSKILEWLMFKRLIHFFS